MPFSFPMMICFQTKIKRRQFVGYCFILLSTSISYYNLDIHSLVLRKLRPLKAPPFPRAGFFVALKKKKFLAGRRSPGSSLKKGMPKGNKRINRFSPSIIKNQTVARLRLRPHHSEFLCWTGFSLKKVS